MCPGYCENDILWFVLPGLCGVLLGVGPSMVDTSTDFGASENQYQGIVNLTAGFPCYKYRLIVGRLNVYLYSQIFPSNSLQTSSVHLFQTQIL